MLADALRQLWLPGILNVSARSNARFSDWVGAGQYYFDGPVGPDSATFVLTPGVTLQSLFADEISRFASAAIETAIQVTQHGAVPKSLGWLIIQSYYAAFFSAHTLLRTAGISCTQFDSQACIKIDEIAEALGMLTKRVNSGSYRCQYETTRGRIVSIRKSGNKGVHEDFWRVFHSHLKYASNLIVSSPSLPAPEAQAAAGHLDELAGTLALKGCNGGNWLSMVRNQVNYSQKLCAWFPNWPKRQYCDNLFRLQLMWKTAPEKIGLADADDLRRFLRACSFLIALCRATVEDIARRSATGKSFLESTAVRLIRAI